MTYIKPEDVLSPKSRWIMKEIIRDDGEGECSYAMGWWDTDIHNKQDCDKVIVFRWNGTSDKPKGAPISSTHPIWIVLSNSLYGSIIDTIATARVPASKIRKFLNLDDGKKSDEH